MVKRVASPTSVFLYVTERNAWT